MRAGGPWVGALSRLTPLLPLLLSYSIFAFGAEGVANTTLELATTEPEVREILLAQKAAWNWAEFQSRYNFTGWDETTNICDWSGVECAYNLTTEPETRNTDPMEGFTLTIACYNPYQANDQYPSNSTDGTWSYHTYPSCCCSFPYLNGPLIDDLARLEPLTGLNLHGQRLNGTLPEAWGQSGSFPRLEVLDVGQYGTAGFTLEGTLPASWSNPDAFVVLQSLVLGPNRFSGTLPDSWANPLAFPSLTELYLQQALYDDWRPIPESWGAAGAFPRLDYLIMPSNRLNGTLPASLPAVSYIDWSRNGLTGTLPPTWGGNDPYPTQTLILADNQLTGTLPPEWGYNHSLFRTLVGIDLSSSASDLNLLTGPIPASWGPPSLHSLVWINVSGNAICGDPPKGFPMQAKPANRGKVCGAGDPNNTCLADCPPPAAPSPPPLPPVSPFSPPPPGTSSSSASTNVGAIVGGVIGGVAAVLLAAALAFLAMRKGWLRRARRPPRPRSMESAWALAKGMGGAKGNPHAGTGPAQDPPKAGLPPDDSVPSGAVSTGTAASVASDPILRYISTRMEALHRLASSASAAAAEPGSWGGSMTTAGTPGGPHGSGSSYGNVARSGLSVDVQQWEVQWEDLRLERLVGRGSYARVYLAHLHESPVAAKLLMNADECRDEAFVLPPQVLKELQKEAALLLKLRHQNVVGFMGLCPVPPCIVTEYCANGSLFDVLQAAAADEAKAAQLTWPLRVRMALDAARGLLYLHRHSPPIIHRDVKSPNLLVDEHMRVKVADLNLSKILHQDVHSTTQSSIANNPIWLAPEVMAGQRPTAASDVYSFALVMLELLTWELPWGASNGVAHFQVYYLLAQGERPDIPPLQQLPGPDRECLATSYDDYTQLIRECWAENPDERPGFAEVVPRLRRMLDGLSSGVAGASPVPASAAGSHAMPATPTRT